jgi:2,3-bisphosphoglycerate-dependent phosphoglycerate mutase
MRIALVRHAESVTPGPEFEDEYSRPLTEKGLVQALDLIPSLKSVAPDALYSSPYLRAIQTLEPYARLTGQEIRADEEFREHRMADEPISHWRNILRDQWNDFSLVPAGGESFHATAERGLAVLDRMSQLPLETVALAGHGTIITLVLNSVDASVGLEFHLAMPNPAIYILNNSSGMWHLES